MLLGALKNVRSSMPPDADVLIVERWITRVAGMRANLDAITEWDAAEAYDVNALHPGGALRRLFPAGLDDGDFETELSRLECEIARADREREPEPPSPPMTADDVLDDLLTGHAGNRFRYLDVRSVDSWRRERLRWSVNIPLERLPEEAAKVYWKKTDLVVYGDDEASTQAAARELQRLGFKKPRTIPGGFEWFKRRGGWELETGPG
jgi:rhodanese-related sulfurtransferase